MPLSPVPLRVYLTHPCLPPCGKFQLYFDFLSTIMHVRKVRTSLSEGGLAGANCNVEITSEMVKLRLAKLNLYNGDPEADLRKRGVGTDKAMTRARLQARREG